MYASWSARVGAWLIDAVLVGGLVFLAFAGMEIAQINEGDPEVPFVLVPVGIVAILYFPLTMRRRGPHNGQSWGKQALRIRVARNDGRPVSFGFAFLREAVVQGLLYGTFAAAVPLGRLLVWIAYLWPLWDKENRAVHDFIVGTHVVKAQPPGSS